MWLMKTLLTSGCTNQRGAGQDVLTRNAGDGENLLLPFSGVGQLSTAKASVSFSGISWRTPDYFLVSPAA
ncbi:hypothetical protein EQ802_24030 (plasmid) [Enterobacter hormaechei]|nr:hypothetical protein EQ802_24030 [Enterobacter hormaechei]